MVAPGFHGLNTDFRISTIRVMNSNNTASNPEPKQIQTFLTQLSLEVQFVQPSPCLIPPLDMPRKET
jgi:hypothetical protein